MLNAFCRVAPSERFSFLAILAADVHARLFDPFFICISYMNGRAYSG
jgi:hypothetical protein